MSSKLSKPPVAVSTKSGGRKEKGWTTLWYTWFGVSVVPSQGSGIDGSSLITTVISSRATTAAVGLGVGWTVGIGVLVARGAEVAAGPVVAAGTAVATGAGVSVGRGVDVAVAPHARMKSRRSVTEINTTCLEFLSKR